jgi:N-acetylglutamate synthase-like GNAT family acetyltransferase
MRQEDKRYLYIRKAQKEDMCGVVELIETLRLDDTNIKRKQFVVTKHLTGAVVGCARLKPLGDVLYELASVGVRPDFQGLQIGSKMVGSLLQIHPEHLPSKFVYRDVWAVCDSKDYNFFAAHGFFIRDIWPVELDYKLDYCKEKYKDEDIIILQQAGIFL